MMMWTLETMLLCSTDKWAKRGCVLNTHCKDASPSVFSFPSLSVNNHLVVLHRFHVSTGYCACSWWIGTRSCTILTTNNSFNPFTPKSDQFQISPEASQGILHHTV